MRQRYDKDSNVCSSTSQQSATHVHVSECFYNTSIPWCCHSHWQGLHQIVDAGQGARREQNQQKWSIMKEKKVVKSRVYQEFLSTRLTLSPQNQDFSPRKSENRWILSFTFFL